MRKIRKHKCDMCGGWEEDLGESESENPYENFESYSDVLTSYQGEERNLCMKCFKDVWDYLCQMIKEKNEKTT